MLYGVDGVHNSNKNVIDKSNNGNNSLCGIGILMYSLVSHHFP